MRHGVASRFAARSRATVVGLFLVCPAQQVLAQVDKEVVTNETVVHMVTGKLGKDLIIGKITAAVPGFDLSSEGLVLLNTNKVDQNIVKAMFDAAESARRRGIATSVTGIDEVLNNEIIIRLVAAKVHKDLILRKMGVSRSQFDVSANGLVNLNSSKVPSDIIKVMMLPPPPPPAAPEDIPVRAPVGKPPATPEKAAAPAKTQAKPPATKPPPKKPPV